MIIAVIGIIPSLFDNDDQKPETVFECAGVIYDAEQTTETQIAPINGASVVL